MPQGSRHDGGAAGGGRACTRAILRPMPEPGNAPRVLREGEFHHKERFGPGTVCRGAVLLECEWDGGRFESGVMAGGVFRSGDFAGGTFYGGIFLGGRWLGGTWENGFDGTGRYRPRTDHP